MRFLFLILLISVSAHAASAFCRKTLSHGLPYVLEFETQRLVELPLDWVIGRTDSAVVLFRQEEEPKTLFVATPKEKVFLQHKPEVLQQLGFPDTILAVVWLDRYVKVVSIRGEVFLGEIKNGRIAMRCSACGEFASVYFDKLPYCERCAGE